MHTDRMGVHTGRNPGGSGPDQYWRRRAVALVSILGAIGLLAWACSGAEGDDDPPQNASATTSPTSSATIPTVMPTVTVTTTTTPKPAESGGGDDSCSADDLVVSMSGSQSTYAAGARPEFRVTAVNIGSGPCAFDTSSLDVRITSGEDRIWSSAECRRGGAAKETLKRGVPWVQMVKWNRKRGCDGGSIARPGTYVAALKGQKVKKLVFSLR